MERSGLVVGVVIIVCFRSLSHTLAASSFSKGFLVWQDDPINLAMLKNQVFQVFVHRLACALSQLPKRFYASFVLAFGKQSFSSPFIKDHIHSIISI
jgi:hypothetical protein